MTKGESIVDLIGRVLAGLLLGPAAVFIATIVGLLLEASSGITVYNSEMPPLLAFVIALPGSALAGSLGIVTGRYRITLITGLLINAAVFTFVLVPIWERTPVAISVWVMTVGLVTGAAAGAFGGLIGKKKANSRIEADPHTSGLMSSAGIKITIAIKPIQIMVLIVAVSVSTLLMYLVTRPHYDQASNSIRFLNGYKTRIHTDVNALLQEIDTEPHLATPPVGFFRQRSYIIESDHYAFSFVEFRFMTRVDAIVYDTEGDHSSDGLSPDKQVIKLVALLAKRKGTAIRSSKPLRTETQLIQQLAKRIGISVDPESSS